MTTPAADFPVSRIGLGCVTFGREIDADRSFEIMDYAFANGINFFDTAATYGDGASERIRRPLAAHPRPRETHHSRDQSFK
jgi:aryl-alcohol dehydrogenase-like predicted oxidoreductase